MSKLLAGCFQKPGQRLLTISSVAVLPEAQSPGSDFILLLLSHMPLPNVAIYSDSTYEKAGSLENKASL
jgi:hypothetical protein